jgi:diaminopimelate epimerase
MLTARFAYTRGIAGKNMRFETMAGIIEASVEGSSVKIGLTPPRDLRLDLSLDIDSADRILHFVNTGVPHVVHFVEDNSRTPVVKWGKEIRMHKMFQPAGTNANFVEVIGKDALSVRTYERGVEDETMACGTGATAAAVVAALLGKASAPVSVTTSGGETLTIHFERTGDKDITGLYLEGPAGLIYEGELQPDALGNFFR